MQKPKPSSTAFRSLTLQAVMLAITLFASIGMAQADLIPAITFTSYDDADGNATDNTTRGYTFNVTAPVYVAGLSIFDADADGLFEAHDVGLWTLGGQLLASVSIDSGMADPLDSSGHFRYKLLDSVLTLAVDTGYRVGAYFANGSGDKQASTMDGLSTAAGISFVGGAYINDTLSNPISALTFPSNNLTGNKIPGGSLLLTDSPVPEPATLPLMAAGVLFGLAGRRVTKRQ